MSYDARAELIDPSTGEAFATAPVSGDEEVDAAFAAASAAFGGWRDATPAERSLALLRIADAIEASAGQLVAAESQNTGKPIALTAGYFNAGQDCTAATRVLAGPRVHDDFVAALVEQARAQTVAGPDVPDADFGPLNNARQSEVFGPVITVQRFSDEDEALAWANGTEYGLASSIWTSDHGRAMRVSRRLDFGCVWINTYIPLVAEMPHGGFKQSGYGKDLSMYGLEDYTRIKHVMSALD
ncbi:MAG: aldehyde dehydrogenase family protein [Actinomycetota bacterium]|nr:aldehyde dehydrogenase family protein [Actinomycetota bacterium]